MSNLFINLINMSLTASYVAFVIVAVRFVLIKLKTPKIILYALWSVVLFRLICPFSFESSLSLIPTNSPTIPKDTVPYEEAYSTKIDLYKYENTITNNQIGYYVPANDTIANANTYITKNKTLIEVGSFIWILGVIILIMYGVISYYILKQKLLTATLVKDNIFETDRIISPFVMGFIRPKIFILKGLAGKELDYIIKHEKTHIKRFDHIIKVLAYLALVIHWFNPIIWSCYFLMVKDMEMSCDESVISKTNEDIRLHYSNLLLSLSTRNIGFLSPLAFGESSVKSRIRNILNYRRPAFWIMVLITATVVSLSIGLLMNPAQRSILSYNTYDEEAGYPAIKENEIKGTLLSDNNFLSTGDLPEHIELFAWEVINRDINNYELNPEVKIIDSKINRLELIEMFDKLADKPIYVYALEYRLLPDDLSKVVIAGGVEVDDHGWIKETSSMGSPLLVVSEKDWNIIFLGIIMTGTLSEEGIVLETALKPLLELKKEELTERVSIDNLRIKYYSNDRFFGSEVIPGSEAKQTVFESLRIKISDEYYKLKDLYVKEFFDNNFDQLVINYRNDFNEGRYVEKIIVHNLKEWSIDEYIADSSTPEDYFSLDRINKYNPYKAKVIEVNYTIKLTDKYNRTAQWGNGNYTRFYVVIMDDEYSGWKICELHFS
ncbi:UNVERIFIED_CONTAM: beta-lactamase regulating signal transducer with metallopeptidase domain [Acetivibrio alkalicellulosi]